MSRSPIPKVLSTISSHGVEALLMGGQACVLYGAAEFSRDADFVVLPTGVAEHLEIYDLDVSLPEIVGHMWCMFCHETKKSSQT